MPIDFAIDESSTTPPFEQIKQRVIAAITDKTAQVDEKLPAIRALATQLGLAVNTVARSYRELEEEGYVITQGRSGTRVSTHAVPAQIALRQITSEYAHKVRSLEISEQAVLDAVRAALAEEAR